MNRPTGAGMAVGLLLAGAAGVAAAFNPLAGIGVLLAPVGLYFTFLRPFLGVAVVVATIPLELVVVFEGGVTLSRLVAVAVGLGWLFRKLSRGEPLYPLLSLPYSRGAALLIAFVLASATWAEYPNRVLVGALQLIQLFLLSLMIIDVASSSRRVRWLVRTVLASATAAAILTILSYLGGARRAGGEVAGVNGTAELLVVLTPLAFWLLWTERPLVWRLVGVTFPAFALGAIAVTFSRMSFLLLPPVLALLIFESLRIRRGLRWLAVAGAVAVAAGLTFVPADKVVERAASIPEYIEGFSTPTDGIAEMSGRGYHLRIGLEMFKDHPWFGVGYGHYGLHFVRTYQHTIPGSGGKLYTSWRSPHSSHVGMLADLGIVGTAIWGLFLLIPFVGLLRGVAVLGKHGRLSADSLLAKVVLFSFLIEVAAYGLYSPNQREKLFWLVMALAVVVERTARRASRERSRSRPRKIERPARKSAMAGTAFAPGFDGRGASPRLTARRYP